MRIMLHADIPVERFAVLAAMAFLERRPELGALCRAARDSGSGISAIAVQQTLPGVSERGAGNVVRWCRSLDLCDAQGFLSQHGLRAAETDEVPVPEQGVYELWVAEHPLLGARILHAERLVSRADARHEPIEPLPVEPEQGPCFASLVDPRQRMVLRDLPGNHEARGCVRRADRSRLRLRWELRPGSGPDRWQLEGTLDAGRSPVPVKHESESAGVDGWALAATLARRCLGQEGAWSEHQRRLAVRVDRLEDDAQERFLQSFEHAHVELPGRGTFAQVEIHDVPLMPASPEDAERWARARLERQLTREPRYRARGALRELWAERINGTPLEPFQPTLPAHAQLVSELGRRPALLWSLAAPVDLSPVEPDPELLAPMRAGADAPAQGEVP